MYKLWKNNEGNIGCVIKNDGSGLILSIPFDPDNTDYQAYLKWLEEGNQPEPAEQP